MTKSTAQRFLAFPLTMIDRFTQKRLNTVVADLRSQWLMAEKCMTNKKTQVCLMR